MTCNSFGHIEACQYWDIEYPDKVLYPVLIGI